MCLKELKILVYHYFFSPKCLESFKDGSIKCSFRCHFECLEKGTERAQKNNEHD